MPELAKAYVQIIPSAEGIKGNLGKIMDGEAESAGKSAGGKFGSTFGSVAKAGLAAVGAGLAAASAAVVKVAKDAVEGYADYEQLTGGIETLFGTAGKGIEEYAREQGLSIEKAVEGYAELLDVQETVMSNAANAFKTAGISANEYMDMAIQSGASMISSVGGDTAEAARLMDLAIVDMSDNVNKMGTSMESVQNAYRGFAKGNFTMLDNLALGYGGTKEEMGRLLEDAEKLAGLDMFTFDIDSYADIVQAIHIVQENIGITGTTAKEASETISGSVGSMKAAWQNLLVGMADPAADLSGLIGNVVDTAETAFGNILPVAEQALTGIASFVEQIAPVIAEKLPGLVEAVLPSILSAATTLVTALVEALPTLMQVLIEQGPVIINQILTTILDMLPEIIALGMTLITSLATGIAESLPELIPTIVDVVLQIVDILTDPDTLGALLDASIAIIIALAEGLINALPKLLEKAPEIIRNLVTAIVENAPKLVEASFEIIYSLCKGLLDNFRLLDEKGSEIIDTISQGILDTIVGVYEAGKKMILKIKEGIETSDVYQWGRDKLQQLVNGLTSLFPNVYETGKRVINKIWEGLTTDDPFSWAEDLISDFLEGIRQALGRVWDMGKEVVTNVWEGIKNLDPFEWGRDLINSFTSGITNAWNTGKSAITGVAQAVKSVLGFSEPEEGPLSNFHTYAPDMMELFARGIRENEYLVRDQLEKSFDFSDSALKTDRLTAAITGAGGYRFGGTGAAAPAGTRVQDVEAMARAIAAALNGCGVYMDGHAIGKLVTRQQRSMERSYGG